MKKLCLFLAVLMLLAYLPGVSRAESWEERILATVDSLEEDGVYTDLDHVAAYLVFFGTLPPNYITAAEARKLGWKSSADLWDFAPGRAIGGDVFENREGLLPDGDWRQCDLFYEGGARGPQRLVYGEEDALWYSDDGFRSFTLVYPSHDEALIPNAAVTAAPSKAPKATATPAPAPQGIRVEKDGTYSDKEHVALYIHLYGRLPSNYITKARARDLGWGSVTGNLWKVAPGCSIGGDHFGNYEGKLPTYTDYRECDIDYAGGSRNAKRIIYGADGSIYYTDDHYETFEKLY